MAARRSAPMMAAMKSAWSDGAAEDMVARYQKSGIGRDLALRVYTSRLLGRDKRLVLHGGGNTSLKTHLPDLMGEDAEVLCVKGSGWDMAEIEPAGLPAVRLGPLRGLRRLDALTDEDMVRVQRANLLDPMAPNPSVETLLHAFLPQAYVDHTHATAVLSIADQPDGAARCVELYGARMGLVPYIPPGFALAKTAAEIYEADPQVEGLVLLKHGIFTFGDSARQAYERMIEMVTLAEERLARRRNVVFIARPLPQHVAPLAAVAPILRGACSRKDEKIEGAHLRLVLAFRDGPAVLDYVNGAELERYAGAGVVTPDHTIRTKNYPLIVPPPEAGRLDAFARAVRAAAQNFVADYEAYFARHNASQTPPKRMLDPLPRVILVPGLGLFGLGRSAKDAAVAADIAENAIETITGAEAIGRFESLSPAELFDMEYWSLEQAKLGKAQDKALQAQVAIITGAGGAIGAATARALRDAGAEVALLDIDEARAQAQAKALGGAAFAVRCDVTDEASVRAAFDRVVERFGGIDILVSNAGAAWQGRIGEVEESVLRQSFELNFFAHQRAAQGAVRVMLAQGTGGALLFNVSKQAVNPGANFGPYGLPKAATLFLVRQYALDYGSDGIRANAVNADRIRSGLLSDAMIAGRAKARGLSEADYMAGNLLGREVTADDVAQAFLHHAVALKTTGDVTTVDGGNIAAALR
jgi:rhamnose utilization protein RhaD (predicted bifunctional aldolase and dehydrogenase)/NAD(P)-dependent dehydrogenase (short-subunit alcohol dehydrogenase family)